MRCRSCGVIMVLAAAIAALFLGSPLAGQAPASETRAWEVPRTPAGQPDLQGVWSYATLTPMERPSTVSGKGTLTDAEAADFEAQTLLRQNRDFNVPEGNVGDYNNFWYDRGSSVVQSRRTSLVIDPADGRIPPLTAAAAERQTKMAEARGGIGLDEPTPGGFVEDMGPGQLRVRCILGSHSGPPITPGAYNNHVRIVQTPGYVAIVDEQIHTTRIVPLDGRPHGPIRKWTGDSRARWDGDTLVIDTTNFRPETQFDTRMRFSANLHVVERFTRVDADTLVYRATLEDPTTWTRPWTYEVPMTRTDDHMYEYACHEGNYGIVNILAGAREKERAGK